MFLSEAVSERGSTSSANVGKQPLVPTFSAEAARGTGTHQHPGSQPASAACLAGAKPWAPCSQAGRGSGVVRVHARHFQLPPLSGRNRGPFPKAVAVEQGRGIRPGWPRTAPRSQGAGSATLPGGLRPPNKKEAAPAPPRRGQVPASRPTDDRGAPPPSRSTSGKRD